MILDHVIQSVLKSINCKCKKSGGKGTCLYLKGGLLITVSVFGNSVLMDHLIKWLAVKVAMTQTAMILM